MGKEKEAVRLLFSRYNDNPSYRNGIELLREKFDLDIWVKLQHTLDPSNNKNIIRIVEDRVTSVMLLANYIHDKEKFGTGKQSTDLPKFAR